MKATKKKLIRITTVPISLDKLLEGQLKFMTTYFDVTAISGDDKYLKKIALREEVNYFEIEMTRKITPLKDLIAVWKLYWFLKSNKPDILHSHTPKAGIIGMVAARLAGVPVRLHTVAGLPLMEAVGIRRKILDVVERLTYQCASFVYPNSKGLKDIIVKSKYTSEDKLKVILNGSSNGIDTHHFNSEQFDSNEKEKLKVKLGILPDEFVYIFVGRLVKDKGIVELVEAFVNLHMKFHKVKLLLVGPFEQELDPLPESTLDSIQQHPNIITMGYQKEVRPFFAISDILVFPSYREGFPNVVMQAGAMGLPAIVSDINGCNEIVEEGSNGTIIPVKNEKAIKNAMEKMLLDKEYFSNLKQKARSSIVSRYEQKAVWEAILAEYNTHF
ncbi:glycosyltransferase family 4 protein [Flavobacterium orientale]|nr:glycosyltransferase family 4 protein [Flavobacterium orientale]